MSCKARNKTRVYGLIEAMNEVEYQDIADTLHISLEQVQGICEELEDEGLIEHPDDWMWDYIWQQMKADK